MHPDLREGNAVGAFALGDFVFMVREDEVRTAPVDVEGVPEQVLRHRGAFDVPARTAAAPLRIPGGFAGLGGLPENEVERIALRGIHLDAGARLLFVKALARELPVAREAAHGVVDVAVLGLIGEALFGEKVNEAQHLRNVLRRAGFVRGRKAPEREHVFLHGSGELVGELVRRHAPFGRAADDLVVDVRDVAHEGDLVARRFEPAAHDVEGDEGAAVSDVAVVVHRHAADVHPNVVRLDGRKGRLRAAQRGVNG